MNARKVEVSLRNLRRALDRLGEALEVPESNTLAIDGSIQRFEFALELFWKTLKRLLAEEGVETSTPKDTLRKAFQAGWLTDEAADHRDRSSRCRGHRRRLWVVARSG